MSQTPEEKQYFYCCDSCACDPGSEYIHITEYQRLEKRISDLETALTGMVNAITVMPRPPHPLYIAIHDAKEALKNHGHL